MFSALVAVQGWIHDILSAQLKTFAATRDWGVLVAMLPLGVAFGAVHALMPGHGKTILASYVIGSRLAAIRSLAVSAALTATHIGSAVLLALVGAPLVSKTLGNIGRAPSLEVASRVLLGTLGLWLLFRALRGPKSHTHDARDGVMLGVAAGLIPCPLTLFAMILAIARGVPEAGLTFAFAMVGGVGLTLAGVTLLAGLARDHMLAVSAQYGQRIQDIGRVLDTVSGVLLVLLAWLN